jgi:hypothetical protein
MLAAAKQGFDLPGHVEMLGNGFVGRACKPFYSPTSWPIVSADGQYALAVFGEIYLSDGSPLREDNFESRFLRPFLQDPRRILLELDGCYSFAVVSHTGELWLATDPFGTFALHYSTVDDGLAFGSQMAAVQSLRNKCSTDRIGVEEYLGLGMTLRGRTLVADINRMGNASLLHRLPNGVTTVAQYYRPEYREKSRDVRRTLSEIHQILAEGVARRTSYENVAASLTGGFDSRATWSMILAAGNPSSVTAHTHGLPHAHDIEIATRITDALRIPHDVFLLSEALLKDMPRLWEETARLGEGVVPISHSFALPVFQSLGQQFTMLLDSYGGAFYRRQRMKNAERRIDRSKDIVSQIRSYEQSPLLRSGLLRRDVAQNVLATIDRGLREYYSSIEHVHELGDKLDLYHFEQVDAMKDSMLCNMEMNFKGVQHPLMNRHAIDLAATLPVAARRRDAVHKYIIAKSYPTLQHFAMDNVGFPAPYFGFSSLRYGAMVLEIIARRMQHLGIPVPTSLMLRRPTIDLEHILSHGMDYMSERLLDRSAVVADFVQKDALETAIQSVRSGEYGSGHALMQLLTLELYLGQNRT